MGGSMKVAILAGGRGTRLAEETDVRPKPMVEIGGRPILAHLMDFYSRQGFNDFTIALGYKGEVIKRWMIEQSNLDCDISIDFQKHEVTRQQRESRSWQVDLVDTGMETLTGGRLLRLRRRLGQGTFMLTYGDGLADVDLHRLLAFHRSHGKLATMTAVRPPARFGRLEMDGDTVREFSEKPQTSEGWINGGFFVLEPAVLEYIDGDQCSWEAGPLARLAADGHLMAYKHDSFWQCMDTLRDRQLLEALWTAGEAPWDIEVAPDEDSSHRRQGLHRRRYGPLVAVGGA